MKWKALFVGTVIGVIGGYSLTECMLKKQYPSPEEVLKKIKREFKKQGPITGSWICTDQEQYEKGPLHFNVYKGGISRKINGKIEQYEFIADVESGNILDIYPLVL